MAERPLTPRKRQLVEKHAHLVPPIARYVARRLPSCVTIQELEAEGYLALSRAAATYQAKLGGFPQWARIKVKGALIDAYKGVNWPKREIQFGHGRPDHNGGGGLFYDSLWNPGTKYKGSHDTPAYEGEEQRLGETHPSQETVIVERQTTLNLGDRLIIALRQLSALELTYLELREAGMTLGEIAEQEKCGITTVHRVLEGALTKLRAELADLKPRKRNGP